MSALQQEKILPTPEAGQARLQLPTGAPLCLQGACQQGQRCAGISQTELRSQPHPQSKSTFGVTWQKLSPCERTRAEGCNPGALVLALCR